MPVSASPTTTLTRSGSKYFAASSASSAETRGVSSEGLISARSPAASAATSGESVNWIGIVPRRDDADDAERLRREAIARRQERQLGRNAARPHPAREPSARIEDGAAGHEQFGDARLLRGAAAEIGVDRGDEGVLVVVDQLEQPVEALASRGGRRVGIGGEGAPLRGEALGELGKAGELAFISFLPARVTIDWTIIAATTRASPLRRAFRLTLVRGRGRSHPF